jgi:hypothetical protein
MSTAIKHSKLFRKDYLNFKNKELSIIYGVCVKTIINHALKLGLPAKKRGRPPLNLKRKNKLYGI